MKPPPTDDELMSLAFTKKVSIKEPAEKVDHEDEEEVESHESIKSIIRTNIFKTLSKLERKEEKKEEKLLKETEAREENLIEDKGVHLKKSEFEGIKDSRYSLVFNKLVI